MFSNTVFLGTKRFLRRKKQFTDFKKNQKNIICTKIRKKKSKNIINSKKNMKKIYLKLYGDMN